MFHQFYCDSFLLIDRYSHFEILRWVKSSVLSQAAMIFQWIKPGGPPGLKYLGRTLYSYRENEASIFDAKIQVNLFSAKHATLMQVGRRLVKWKVLHY